MRYKLIKTSGNPLISKGFELESLNSIIVKPEQGVPMSLGDYLVAASALAGQAAGSEAEQRIEILEGILDVEVQQENVLSTTVPNILVLSGNRTFIKPTKPTWTIKLFVKFIENASLYWENDENPFLTGVAGEKKSVTLISFGDNDVIIEGEII